MTLALKVDMIYGPTKSTKTSRLGDAVEFFYNKNGKVARGVFSDTGGYDAIAYLKDEGKLVPFILSAPARGERLLEDMDKLSRGWWPENPDDETSKLLPPKLDEVGLYLFDGATSWCGQMMTFHEAAVKYVPASDSMVATVVRAPDMPKDSFQKSGDFIRRFTGKSDYGAVQGRISEFIRNTAYLPCRTIWTALVSRSEDDTTKAPCFGPDFIGNKLTGKSGPWFGNLLHIDSIPVEKVEKVDGKDVNYIDLCPFIYTRPHVMKGDVTKTPYMAGLRVDKRIWNKMPLVMPPDLAKFYETVEKLAEEAKSMGSVLVSK